MNARKMKWAALAVWGVVAQSFLWYGHWGLALISTGVGMENWLRWRQLEQLDHRFTNSSKDLQERWERDNVEWHQKLEQAKAEVLQRHAGRRES